MSSLVHQPPSDSHAPPQRWLHASHSSRNHCRPRHRFSHCDMASAGQSIWDGRYILQLKKPSDELHRLTRNELRTWLLASIPTFKFHRKGSKESIEPCEESGEPAMQATAPPTAIAPLKAAVPPKGLVTFSLCWAMGRISFAVSAN